MTSQPVFGIALTLISYMGARILIRKVPFVLFNPTIIGALFCIALLQILGVPIADYLLGGNLIMMLIFPATICLAIMVYQHREQLLQHLLPILVGCTVGSVVSVLSVRYLSNLFGLSELLTQSLVVKSVTTPIAIELAQLVSGDVSITVLAVMLTGVTSPIIGPLLFKLFGITDPVLQGIAMGTASHAIGTSRAMEMGPIQGALSSIALVVTGLVTLVLMLLLY
jgi:putative effector of murein hydrolase